PVSDLFSSSALTIDVAHDVVNHGTISMPGGSLTLRAGGDIHNESIGSTASMVADTINLTAGSGLIRNSGLINAGSTLNLQTGVDTNLLVNNNGGLLRALNEINLRDSSYQGSANTKLIGGDLDA